MKVFRWWVLLLCIGMAWPAQAGGMMRFWQKSLTRTSVAQEKQIQAFITRQLARNPSFSPAVARLAQQDRLAYFNTAQFIPFQEMATLSVPTAAAPVQEQDALFAARNDKMAFPWMDIVDRDLQFLTTHQAELLHTLHTAHISTDEINFAALIPPHVRKIYVGEEHHQPVIYHAFEQLVLQYQEMYPNRPLIVLTEFVSDRLLPWQKPGRPVHMLELPLRQNNKQFAFLKNLMSRDIRVIGLENVEYIKRHETLITPAQTQAQSVYGLQERNTHWRKIIDDVAEQNPNAVLFIYAGSMHTHYRAPFTLSNPSEQNFVLQLEVNRLGPDMPFGYVMQNYPFVHAVEQDVTVLFWPHTDTVFRTRSGFDICLIFPPAGVEP